MSVDFCCTIPEPSVTSGELGGVPQPTGVGELYLRPKRNSALVRGILVWPWELSSNVHDTPWPYELLGAPSSASRTELAGGVPVLAFWA